MPKTHQRRGQCLIHRNTGSSELTCKSTGNLCLPPREDDLRHQNRSVKINVNIKRALILLYCVVLFQKAAAKKVDWRKKHDNFIKSVRTAREIDEAIKTGTLINQCIVFNNHFLSLQVPQYPPIRLQSQTQTTYNAPTARDGSKSQPQRDTFPFVRNRMPGWSTIQPRSRPSRASARECRSVHQPNEQIV